MPKKKTYRVKWKEYEFTRTTANIYTHMLVAQPSADKSWRSICFCGNIMRAETQYSKWKHAHPEWDIRILEIPQPTDVPVYQGE